MTRDDAVAIGALLLHPEIGAAMRDEHVEFLETVRIEQQFDPFASGQLALGVLRVDPFLAAAQTGRLPAVLQFLKNVLHEWLPFAPVRCGMRATLFPVAA